VVEGKRGRKGGREGGKEREWEGVGRRAQIDSCGEGVGRRGTGKRKDVGSDKRAEWGWIGAWRNW
jgi:hypothetical protein